MDAAEKGPGVSLLHASLQEFLNYTSQPQLHAASLLVSPLQLAVKDFMSCSATLEGIKKPTAVGMNF